MPDSKAIIAADVSLPRPLVPAFSQGHIAGARIRPGRLAENRPLPDATCIYPVAIPHAAPPYDDAPRVPAVLARGDDPPEPPVVLVRGGYPPEPPAVLVRGDTLLTGGHPRTPDGPEPPASLRVVPALAVLHPPGGQARSVRACPPAHVHGQGAPEGGSWPGRFAQALAETLAGSRPPEQIAAWTTEQARKRISQLGPLMATVHRPRVRRLLVASPASGVLEMTIVVGVGPRVRALAVRLERADQLRPGHHGQPGQPEGAARWRCTAVDAA